MVLLEAIAGGTLFGLKSQPAVQQIMAFMMVGSISAATLLVLWLIVYFAIKRPGLLFNPRDIESSVHMNLYGFRESPMPYSRISDLSFELLPPEDNDRTN
jgi:hypothetical protein